MMHLKIGLIGVFCWVTTAVSAQSIKCGNELTDPLIHQPQSPAARAQLNRIRHHISSISQQNRGASTPIRIPVVVHIIHDNGAGEISDSQVIDGIRIINEDFNYSNPDTAGIRDTFMPFAAHVGFQFELAQLDPDGNPTNGIVRVNSPLIPHPEPTDSAFDNVKFVSHWPSESYYNIWLVRTIRDGVSGYAQYPGTAFTYGGPWRTWGIVVKSNQWGSIGTAVSDGRTGTHEVGHTFGLYHPFLSFSTDCGTSCDTTGDEVCDTPPCRPTSGCSSFSNTCSNDTSGPSPFHQNMPDQVENFMAYNTCSSMFTKGQKDRMLGYLAEFDTLQMLIATENLVKTGLLTYPASIPEISTLPQLTLVNPANQSLYFNIQSNAPVNIIALVLYSTQGHVVARFPHSRPSSNDHAWYRYPLPQTLSNGLYFLKIQHANGVIGSPLIINR